MLLKHPVRYLNGASGIEDPVLKAIRYGLLPDLLGYVFKPFYQHTDVVMKVTGLIPSYGFNKLSCLLVGILGTERFDVF
jgi:hypothetical protein